MNWTPETIDTLLTMWRQGYSASETARHFGCTKNSIIGKLHRERVRLGLKTEQPRIRDRRKVANADSTVSKRIYTRREAMLTLPDRADSVLRIVSPPPVVPDQGQLASIVDVTGCRWPVADNPDFVGGVAFCNHSQREKSPYCEYHAQVNVAPYSREAIRRTIKQSLYILKVAS
jgi:GcrA cell cycle regulator